MDSKVLGSVPAFQKQAIRKLRDELYESKDKSFAEPVISVLIKRCEVDIIFSRAVMQDSKLWEKCNEYLYFEASLLSQDGRGCAVDNDTVYRWAEDYYLKDDAEIEKVKKKAQTKHPGIKYRAFRSSGNGQKNTASKEAVSEQKEIQAPKSKKKNKDMEGQLDLFSMM